jgi:hypothetical protein
MLYDAERHESLTASAWNEQAARACINEILDDAADKFSARDLWPSHPLDTFSPDARWNLYIGAAGTIWALHHLSQKPNSMPDFSSVLPRLIEPNRSWILNVKGAGLDLRTAGLLTGDTGILLVQAMVNGVGAVAAELGAAIDENRDNPVCELMWGSPGTMLASLWLYEGRARISGQSAFAAMLACCGTGSNSSRRPAAIFGFKISTAIRLRISARCMALFAAIRGWHLLSHSEQSRWAERLADSLRRTARWEDNCANWPQSIGRHRPGRTALLVQHCHGAPGIVNCFAGLPDRSLSLRMRAASARTSSATRPAAGSSRSRSRGRTANARAISTSRRCP